MVAVGGNHVRFPSIAGSGTRSACGGTRGRRTGDLATRGREHVPQSAEAGRAFAIGLPGPGVPGEEVERMAVIRHLLLPARALGRAQQGRVHAAARGRRSRGQKRRPSRGTCWRSGPSSAQPACSRPGSRSGAGGGRTPEMRRPPVCGTGGLGIFGAMQQFRRTATAGVGAVAAPVGFRSAAGCAARP